MIGVLGEMSYTEELGCGCYRTSNWLDFFWFTKTFLLCDGSHSRTVRMPVHPNSVCFAELVMCERQYNPLVCICIINKFESRRFNLFSACYVHGLSLCLGCVECHWYCAVVGSVSHVARAVRLSLLVSRNPVYICFVHLHNFMHTKYDLDEPESLSGGMLHATLHRWHHHCRVQPQNNIQITCGTHCRSDDKIMWAATHIKLIFLHINRCHSLGSGRYWGRKGPLALIIHFSAIST